MASVQRTLLVPAAAAFLAVSVLHCPADDAAQKATRPADKDKLGDVKPAPKGDVSPGESKPLPKPAEDKPPETAPSTPLTLATDAGAAKKIEAAKAYVQGEDWLAACQVLQDVLDRKEDAFVPVTRKGADGKDAVVWVAARGEADRLLRSMAPKGLDVYRPAYRDKAAALLKEAQTKDDPELLARVVRHYLYTDAGPEALQLLAARHFGAAQYDLAAAAFAKLLDHRAPAHWPALSLFQATAVFRRAGDKAGAERALKQLEDKLGDQGLRLGDKTLSLDEVKKELDKFSPPEGPGQAQWPMFRGGPGRNAVGVGGPAFLEAASRLATVRTDAAKNWLVKALDQHQDRRGLPVLPAWFPITATVTTDRGDVPLVIFRSYYGVHAIDLRTGKLRWESDQRFSLDMLARDSRRFGQVQSWMGEYLQSDPARLWENSVVGTLSTDGQRVYLVDDLHPLPPKPLPGPGGDPQIIDALHHNKLLVFDPRSGKILWSLGGRGDRKGHPANELNDSHFLGAPLPMGGKLYALVEKNQELRLVCLDPAKNPDKENPVAWSQALATVGTKIIDEPGRRIQAAHVAYADGLLVCQTNAGAAFAVDALTHGLAWASPYRDQPVKPSLNAWKTSAPAVQDGKVVLTPADGSALLCLSLRDGAPLWKVSRADDDLYLAGVFAGKAVVVGTKSVRAFNLADGKPAWKELETGMPSGQGVAGGSIYYLPLRYAAGSKDKEPEICAIDLEKGAVVGHSKARKRTNSDGQQVCEQPGNLLFFEGMVVSQNVLEVAVFPQAKAKLDEIEKLLKANPNDPGGLAARGELHLADGELAKAVADLRKALDNKPPAEVLHRARNKLYEALTGLLRRDFDAGEPYLKDYEQLCKTVEDPNLTEAQRKAEVRRRLAGYHSLVAKGRERQGKLAEALQAYLDFAAVAPADELLPAPDDPAVRVAPAVWARARIAALLAKAAPDERKRLEEKIEEHWSKVKDGKDLKQLQSFISTFGGGPRSGREARLLLAEKLLDQGGKDNLLAAEQQLLALRHQQDDPQAAGRAVEALAPLLAREGFLDDAGYYYTMLGRDFAKTVVRDGKTGADYLSDLASDPRFRPFLDPFDKAWPEGKVQARSERGNFPYSRRVFLFEHEGEPLPYFRRHQLTLDLAQHQLKLTDRQEGVEKWGAFLARTPFENHLRVLQQNPQLRFPCYSQGHLVVLPLGQLVFGLDPVGKRVLWEWSLSGQVGGAPLRFDTNPTDGGLRATHPDGFVQKAGRLGFVAPTVACLLTRDGLVGLDPVTGQALWARRDVPPHSHVFGDGDYVFLAEVGTDGVVAAARALRSADGAAADVPDFAKAYQNRVRVLGRTLLAKDASKDGLKLRLYDVATGKDLWAQDFPAGSIVAQTEDAALAGVLDPEGKVLAFDLTTRQKVLDAQVLAKHVKDAQAALLLHDADQFYLAVNQPPDPASAETTYPNFYPQTGVRSAPVNGQVYAFTKDGTVKWRTDVARQMLVLTHHQDTPFLLFAALNYDDTRGKQSTSVKAVHKRLGKLVYDEPDAAESAGPQFHTFTVDRKAGEVELISQNRKIVLTTEK